MEKLTGVRDNVRVEQCGFNMSQGTSELSLSSRRLTNDILKKFVLNNDVFYSAEKFFREVTKEDEEDVGPKPGEIFFKHYRFMTVRAIMES